MAAILMRHGEAENNVLHILAGRKLEYHLTEKGRVQVADITEKLKTVPIDTIYTSPITRAIETSQIIAEKIGIDYKIDERLNETEMGSVTGMGYYDVVKKYGNLFLKFYQGDDTKLRNMGVESFFNIGARIGSILDYVAEKHPNKNTLLVTHLDPIKAAISRILDLKPETLFNLSIRNASLTILKHSSKDYAISAFDVMDISGYLLK
ncbi:MAG: histidine phosphatase family protein [Nitrososphaerales archaeon]